MLLLLGRWACCLLLSCLEVEQANLFVLMTRTFANAELASLLRRSCQEQGPYVPLFKNDNMSMLYGMQPRQREELESELANYFAICR
jgi:hypothetical protein